MANVKDLTQGKPLKLIVLFALPLMLGNACQQLYVVADTMIVGKGLGVAALAAVGATSWPVWLLGGLYLGISQGASVQVAYDFGSGDYKAMNKTIGQIVTWTVVGSVILTAGSIIAINPMLNIMETPAKIYRDASLYMTLMFAATPFAFAYNSLSCILRALGNSKAPLFAILVATASNIIMDLLFVMVFRWGIAGAAVASGLAQLFSAVYCFIEVRKIKIVSVTGSDLKLDGRLSWQIMRMGLPIAAQNLIICLGGMIVQTAANGFGVNFVAGYTAGNKLFGVLVIVSQSLGFAVQTFVSQNLGAENPDRIRNGIRTGILIGVVSSVAVAATVLLASKLLLGLFISGEPQEVEEAMKYGYQYMVYITLPLPVLYLLDILRLTLMGVGDSMPCMLSSISEFITRFLVIRLLPQRIGEHSIYCSEIFAWGAALLVVATGYFIVVPKLLKRLRAKTVMQ